MSTFVLIPGAGRPAWYWHRVLPLLRDAGHEAIAVDLPGEDATAGLSEYAGRVVDAIAGRADVVLVAQSLGGFTRRGSVEALRDRREHLRGGLRAAFAFQTGVVVGRHVAQGGDLLTPQPDGPAPLTASETDVLGLQRLATAAEELRQPGTGRCRSTR